MRSRGSKAAPCYTSANVSASAFHPDLSFVAALVLAIAHSCMATHSAREEHGTSIIVVFVCAASTCPAHFVKLPGTRSYLVAGSTSQHRILELLQNSALLAAGSVPYLYENQILELLHVHPGALVTCLAYYMGNGVSLYSCTSPSQLA